MNMHTHKQETKYEAALRIIREYGYIPNLNNKKDKKLIVKVADMLGAPKFTELKL
jgi:hypothetical protein